ncbi:MAG: prepilin-type N-terminal cleavage/methylation domain-containing protein [Patescibacteria group bacterium]
MLWAQKQKGFTIVELLIVVVVIAILAAITITAYNGIQNRAKASAAQSAAAQAAKKVATNFILNSETYPAYGDLESITGLKPSSDNSTPYQYTVSIDQKTFCLTTTTSNLSYYVTNTNSNPTVGACPTHNLNGVITNTITNLMPNPSVETASTGWALNANLSPNGTGGRVQVGGKWVIQGTRNATVSTAIYMAQSTPITVTANTSYTVSALVTSSVAQSLSLQIRIGGTATGIGAGTTLALAAGVPTRIIYTVNVGANTSVFPTIFSSAGSIGDIITVDEVMFTEGTTQYSYADGNTSGWIWSGTANLSSSSGPPV